MRYNVIHADQRLLAGREAFRFAAGPPCRFIPLDFGRGVIPLDNLHSSFRDPRGP